ncbi:hypothetical protein CDL15_Pgr028837 [Punica granatum]|uniref:Uncharacterized protein n=1 Tax=Punica granatum TaxID=22663 RepID=A0A218WXT6_PUNGR|nr:hypothetical protein CDL15_Pgr028837 [Punica granatum]
MFSLIDDDVNLRTESDVCSYYQKGTCTYGSRCRFEHVKSTGSWHPASSSSASFQSKDADAAPSHDLFSKNTSGGVNVNYCVLGDSSSKKTSVPCRLWHGASSSSAALQTKVSGSVPQPLSTKSALGRLNLSSAQVSASKRPLGSERCDYIDGGDLADTKAERPGNCSICSLAAEGNCPNGENCPYIHGDLCSTCGKHCLHPSSPQERDEHAKACEEKQKQLEAMKLSEEIECSICFDRILLKPPAERKFGILSECDHPFCITCIRNWRRSSPASGMDVNSASRSCPICRKLSYFVVPSDIWYTTKEEKERIISNYKARLKLIDCKHFNFGNGNCPFGSSCFYKHTVKPGSYTWIHHRPPPPRRRNRVNMSSMFDAFEQLWSLDDLIGGGEYDDEDDMDYYDLNYLIDPVDFGFDSNDLSDLSRVEMALLLHQLGLDHSDPSSDEE